MKVKVKKRQGGASLFLGRDGSLYLYLASKEM